MIRAWIFWRSLAGSVEKHAAKRSLLFGIRQGYQGGSHLLRRGLLRDGHAMDVQATDDGCQLGAAVRHAS